MASRLDDLDAFDLPSASAAIANPDGLWVGTMGMADMPAEIRVEPCQKFSVGSHSKVATAAAVLVLADAGQLELDDRAAAYLPQETVDAIENLDRATLRQLLRQETGIPDYVDANYVLDAFNGSLEPLDGSTAGTSSLTCSRTDPRTFGAVRDVTVGSPS